MPDTVLHSILEQQSNQGPFIKAIHCGMFVSQPWISVDCMWVHGQIITIVPLFRNGILQMRIYASSLCTCTFYPMVCTKGSWQ